MDSKDFPKRYGGDLAWEWGDLPHLDQETRAALEKDGNKGWVRGPNLWLEGQRVVVGSVRGKLRRPDTEVESKLPIVYAADYTETPVHPDRKLSKASSKLPITDGAAEVHHTAEAEAQKAAPDGATAAVVIASKTEPKDEQPASITEAPAPAPAPAPSEPQAASNKLTADQHARLEAEGKNIRSAPVDGSAVHVPEFQPAHPAITAEYVSVDVFQAPAPSSEPVVAPVAPAPAPAVAPVARPAVEPASQPAIPASQHKTHDDNHSTSSSCAPSIRSSSSTYSRHAFRRNGSPFSRICVRDTCSCQWAFNAWQPGGPRGQ